METGNPKQVAVLAVVAFAALGYAVTRLGGKAPAPVAAARSAAVPQAAHRSATPSQATGDPFSHPKLAPKAPPKTEAADSPTSGTPSSFPTKPSVLVGDLTSVPSLPTAFSTTALQPAAPGDVPKAPTPPATVAIALEATASASEAVAFLCVDGGESRPFHPNERIKGAIRLLAVGDGSVTLSGPKGRLTLSVGERKQL